MKPDWTTRDPAITQTLQVFGRSSVPLWRPQYGERIDTPEGMATLPSGPRSPVRSRPCCALSYGITEDLQLSLSLPVPLYAGSRILPVRELSRMPATGDIESVLGWRFDREATDVGARRESTA